MTQTNAQQPGYAAGEDEQTDFLRLMEKPSGRQGPLASEDALLDFMDVKAIRSLIEHAFPGDLSDRRRTEKANALVEQARCALAASEDREGLCRCTKESFVQAIASCAALDLSFLKALGQAYLIRFGSCATLMPGYRGFITLIMRTGVVSSIQVEAVYKGEDCTIVAGQPIHHVQGFDVDRTDDKIVGVYAEARMLSGPPVHVMLNSQEKDRIKATSKSAQKRKGPWMYWEGEQWKKSAIRRLQKQLPMGADDATTAALAKALEIDNQDYALMSKESEAGLREHGRGILAKSRASGVVDAEPEPEPSSAPPDNRPAPIGDVIRFKDKVAVKREKMDALSDDDFLAAACEAEGLPAVDELTSAQLAGLESRLHAHAYDWETGDQLPADDPQGPEQDDGPAAEL